MSVFLQSIVSMHKQFVSVIGRFVDKAEVFSTHSVDKLGLGHVYNVAVIDIHTPGSSTILFEYVENCILIHPARRLHGVPFGQDIMAFTSSSLPRIRYATRAVHACQHSRTSVSISPRTLRLSIKALTTPVFNVQLAFFFFSDIHLLLWAWLGVFSVLLRFHAS